MAGRVGFEPTIQISAPYTSLAVRRAQPLHDLPIFNFGIGGRTRTFNLQFWRLRLYIELRLYIGGNGEARTLILSLRRRLLIRLNYIPIWRREWDSNPRCRYASLVFKTSPLIRSGISPYYSSFSFVLELYI